MGKTRGLSRLAAWWIGVHPIGEALVVVTSDNDDSIIGGVWNELIAQSSLKERALKEQKPELANLLPDRFTLVADPGEPRSERTGGASHRP